MAGGGFALFGDVGRWAGPEGDSSVVWNSLRLRGHDSFCRALCFVDGEFASKHSPGLPVPAPIQPPAVACLLLIKALARRRTTGSGSKGPRKNNFAAEGMGVDGPALAALEIGGNRCWPDINSAFFARRRRLVL